jgi:hypothetical protein
MQHRLFALILTLRGRIPGQALTFPFHACAITRKLLQ